MCRWQNGHMKLRLNTSNTLLFCWKADKEIGSPVKAFSVKSGARALIATLDMLFVFFEIHQGRVQKRQNDQSKAGPSG